MPKDKNVDKPEDMNTDDVRDEFIAVLVATIIDDCNWKNGRTYSR